MKLNLLSKHLLTVLVVNTVAEADPVNVALNNPSVSSSNCYDGLASGGNDGDDGVIFDPVTNPCVHTCSEQEPYWRVDLQQR